MKGCWCKRQRGRVVFRSWLVLYPHWFVDGMQSLILTWFRGICIILARTLSRIGVLCLRASCLVSQSGCKHCLERVEQFVDETRSGTHQDLRMSYAFLQVTQHIYDRNEHSRLHSLSHRHMRCHTHSICSRHALQQVLIFSSTYRLRIAGDYALLMFVTCFDSIPTAGTTLDRVSTVRPSSSAYAQRMTIVKALPRSTTFHIASNAL